MPEHVDVVQTDPGIAPITGSRFSGYCNGDHVLEGGIRADLIQKEIEFNCTSLEGEHHLAWIYHYGLKHPINIIKSYLARSFRSSRPSLFLSKIFIYKSRRQRLNRWAMRRTHTHKKANIYFAQPCALPSACSGCLPKPWATRHPVLAPSVRVAQGNSKTHQLSDSNNQKQLNTSTTPFPPYMGIKQVCRKDLQKLNTDIALALK